MSLIVAGTAIGQLSGSLDWSGCDLTYRLMDLLKESGYPLTSYAEREIVRNVKEKLCYIAADAKAESALPSADIARQFELPDGQTITVGNERFMCAESLFDSSMMTWSGPKPPLVPVQQLVVDTIQRCDKDLRRQLFGKVVLSGGSTLLPGFAERLKVEVDRLTPTSSGVNLIDPALRLHGAWMGGSLLASLSSFQRMWMTKDGALRCAGHLRRCSHDSNFPSFPSSPSTCGPFPFPGDSILNPLLTWCCRL